MIFLRELPILGFFIFIFSSVKIVFNFLPHYNPGGASIYDTFVSWKFSSEPMTQFRCSPRLVFVTV